MKSQSLETVLDTKLSNPKYDKPFYGESDSCLNSVAERKLFQEVIYDARRKGFKTFAEMMLESIVTDKIAGRIQNGSYQRYFRTFLNAFWEDDAFRDVVNRMDPCSSVGVQAMREFQEKKGSYAIALSNRALGDNHKRPGEGAETEMRILMHVLQEEMERRKNNRDILWFEQMIKYGMMDERERK